MRENVPEDCKDDGGAELHCYGCCLRFAKLSRWSKVLDTLDCGLGMVEAGQGSRAIYLLEGGSTSISRAMGGFRLKRGVMSMASLSVGKSFIAD